MSKITYEEDLAVLINLMEHEHDALWLQSEHAVRMVERYGRKTASMIATDVGRTASYIRQMIATAKAFPKPEDRADDLSFSHHRIAAMTENPAAWIDKAAQNSWSQRELKQAIKDTKDRLSDAERARRTEERMEQAVAKYNEQWAEATGKRAVLAWEHVQLSTTAATPLTAHIA